MQELSLSFLYRMTMYKSEIYVYWLIGNVFLASYFSYDIDMMIYKRNKYYDVECWYNGFIHLQVDIFYCFWRDLFLSWFQDIENDQKIDQNDSLPTIHITVEEADNEDYKKNWTRESNFEIKLK